MIVGDGLVAKAFSKKYEDDNNIIIFASGVSNSKENNQNNFIREKSLLSSFLDDYPDTKFVYFSTTLIGYKDNPYYTHKKEMEGLIKKTSSDYVIIRVPQLIGVSGNNNTLINYLVGKIRSGVSFDVYGDVKRAVLDVSDLVDFVGYCLNLVTCESITIGGVEPISVVDLSKKIGYILNVEPIMNIKNTSEDDKWTLLSCDIFKQYLTKYKIKTNGYTEKTIKKYINI
jgi:nucleoside-diphosphate-sugar epimerase